GNLRRVGVGVVHLPIHHVAVNLSVEGGTQQADGSGDIERLPARFDAVHGEALAGEPVFDGGEVLVGGAETGAELGGGEPLVVVGRAGSVLLLDELAQAGFLRGTALE